MSRHTASALKFSCFGSFVNISGNGGPCIRVVRSGLHNFLKTHGLTHLSDSADHGELIEIYIVKKLGPERSLGSIITCESKNCKM